MHMLTRMRTCVHACMHMGMIIVSVRVCTYVHEFAIDVQWNHAPK